MTPQQSAFADYFRVWGLFLPDEAVAARRDGHVHGAGWMVRFRWREDGTVLVRAGHRMTNERMLALTPDGAVEQAEPAAPGEGMAWPADATPEEKAVIEQEYRSAWTRHARAVTEAGLEHDTSGPPPGLETAADRQRWRLDDGGWHLGSAASAGIAFVAGRL